MSFDVDEKEFYETFAELAADPNRGLDGAMEWAWSALQWTQQELQEHHRLAGMGSEREARLMAQLEEARKELQNRELQGFVIERDGSYYAGNGRGVDNMRKAKVYPTEEAAREDSEPWGPGAGERPRVLPYKP